MNKKFLIAIVAIILIICVAAFAMTNNNTSSSNASISVDANALEDRGRLIVDSEKLDEHNVNYHAENPEVNGILVTNTGSLKLTDSIVNKTGDTSTSGDDADFYGVNSAILVNNNATLDISNVEINTNSKGSNGIFVTNAATTVDNSSDSAQSTDEQAQAPDGNGGGGQPGQATVEGSTEATVKNVKITTHSDKSRGLDATYNGVINAENVVINTDGQSCAALATDRGEGEVHVKNSNINTGVSKDSGRGSPLIYSTGNITLENSAGTAFVSQIACIEGKNSIELTNCELTGYAGGNRQDGDEYVDLGGVFIYQSMSGDADVGTSLFTAKNSQLKVAEDSPVYKQAPMFHVTNTACVINLENTELSFGSGVFLDDSGQNQWGTEGSNGGTCELNTDSEDITGNVIVDSISSLNWNMKNTKYNGAINSTGNTTVNVGEGSTWTLSGYSSVSSLELTGNIEYGEYTLTVDGKTYNSSNPFKG